jgi:hypothetical protein
VGTTNAKAKEPVESVTIDPIPAVPNDIVTKLEGTNWEPLTVTEVPAKPVLGERVTTGESSGTVKVAAAA